jgi:hypothetical protein
MWQFDFPCTFLRAEEHAWRMVLEILQHINWDCHAKMIQDGRAKTDNLCMSWVRTSPCGIRSERNITKADTYRTPIGHLGKPISSFEAQSNFGWSCLPTVSRSKCQDAPQLHALLVIFSVWYTVWHIQSVKLVYILNILVHWICSHGKPCFVGNSLPLLCIVMNNVN